MAGSFAGKGSLQIPLEKGKGTEVVSQGPDALLNGGLGMSCPGWVAAVQVRVKASGNHQSAQLEEQLGVSSTHSSW